MEAPQEYGNRLNQHMNSPNISTHFSTPGTQADTATRLLTWINSVQPDAALDLDDLGVQIASGLCSLAACQDAAILVRELPGDDLVLLTGSQMELEEAPGEEPVPPRLAARPLLEILPEQSFIVSGAVPQLRALIGEVSDFVRDNSQTSANAFSLRSLPMFAVPLRSLNAAGFTEVIGLALLWSNDQADTQVTLSLLQAVATQASGWLSTAVRMDRLGRSYRMLAGVLADAVDNRDSNSNQTSRAVSYYSGLIARELALPSLHIARIEIAGLLHHIGKLAVPDAILHKAIPLSAAERDFVRSAIIEGAAWLSTVEGLQEVADMVRYQGENYDGTGYPDQLVGVEIPVGARIIAVARRFTAMTSRRAERRPLSVVGGALESVTEESGRAFDPRVVNAFLAALGRTV